MRVLVVPTSKYGGTAEIGRAIANELRRQGVDVDVSQPEHMFDPGSYAGYVLGSGLYMGDWIDRAKTFVDEFGEIIRRKPTWLFSSGPLGAAKPEEPVKADVVEQLLAKTGALEHRLFSGRLEIDKLSRSERFIAKWVGATDGDFREWDEIEQWANQIVEHLQKADTGTGQPTAGNPADAPVSL